MTTDRDANIHTARVYLREARARASNPKQRAFCFTLLTWAANARRRAAMSIQQRELFVSVQQGEQQ